MISITLSPCAQISTKHVAGYLRRGLARQLPTSWLGSLLVVVVAVLTGPGLLVAQEPVKPPTKQIVIQQLKNLQQLLAANKFDEAAKYFVLPPNFKPEMLKGPKSEISMSGIVELEKNGTLGPAIEIFGETRADYFAKRAGMEADKCIGFKHSFKGQTAEVMGVWDGRQLKLVRLDDVHKVGTQIPAKAAPAPAPAANTPGQNESPLSMSREAVMKRLPQWIANSEANPNDLRARGTLAMAQYRIGNLPVAWELMLKNYQANQTAVGIQRGLNVMFEDFRKRNAFTVGVPTATTEGLLGKPAKVIDLGNGMQRHLYGFFAIDFKQGKLHRTVDLRGTQPVAFQPKEVIAITVPAGWICVDRHVKRDTSSATYMPAGQMMGQWEENLEIKRFIGAAKILGTAEVATKQMAEQIKKIHPEAQSKVLEANEGSVISANLIPKNKFAKFRHHQLIRYFKPTDDVHRIAITVDAETMDQAVQRQWLKLFREARLQPVETK